MIILVYAILRLDSNFTDYFILQRLRSHIMNKIDKATKKILDQQLDEGLLKIKLPNQGKSFVDFLRYLEWYWRFSIPSITYHGITTESVLISHAKDAAATIIQILNYYYSETACSNGITPEEDVICWKAIFEKHLSYSGICDFMHILWNETYNINQISNYEYEFSYTDTLSKQMAVADWCLNELEKPLLIDNQLNADIPYRILNRSGSLDEKLALRVDDSILKQLNEHIAINQATCWQLDGVIPLDGFELAEFRRFWTALCAIVGIHKYAWSNALDSQIAVSVPIYGYQEFLYKITNLTGLTNGKAKLILDYLIYERPQNSKFNILTPLLQPIFKLANNDLAISPFLSINTNPEENILKHFNRNKPELYDRIKDLKENTWSKQIETALKRYGLIVKTQLKYLDTKLDLIIITKDYSFGLVCELKWILLPNRIKNDDIDYFTKGFDQAIKACNWANNNKGALSEKLQLNSNQLNNCQFKPLLLSKNMILQGLPRHNEVPIVCSRLFDYVISKTEGNIQKLWFMANDKTYLPIENEHFRERKSTIEFNGIKFHVTGLDAIPNKPWVPSLNIKF